MRWLNDNVVEGIGLHSSIITNGVVVQVRVAGIDPGTKTFDVVVVEDGEVVFERSIETVGIARDPRALIDALEDLAVDYVVGPSGYGVPITFGNEVLDPRRFAVEVLLLSTDEDIKSGAEVGEAGIWVYDALAKAVTYLVNRYGSRAMFIPSVIQLQTIPWYRKINKVDMGTVDKLASAFLAVYGESTRESKDLSDVNVIVVEMGYGYVGTMAVKGGKVVDAVGGTCASAGTLTAGAMDLEVVVGAKRWNRWDVFHGGVFWISNTFELEDLIKAYKNSEEPLASLYLLFIEGVAKDIARAMASVPNVDKVVLTGRYGRNEDVVKHLAELMGNVGLVVARGLKGASISKEAGQGYAAIGEGVVGGRFAEVVNHMGIREARGTVVDYVLHQAAKGFRERVIRAYKSLVKNPKLCEKLYV